MSTNRLNEKSSLILRLCAPRGFCAGVDRAIQIVLLALKKYGAPVYVRHEIVHNRYVVEALEARGAVFIEELDEIAEQYKSQPVIFSAHGVARSVISAAKESNIFYLDATCPLVAKVHKQAMRHYRLGRHVLLIGHAGHPEVIGTMGQLPPGSVSLIENDEQARNFTAPVGCDLGYVSQTTLSLQDCRLIIEILQQRFANIFAPANDSICYATTNRQIAVQQAAAGCDFFFIVGAANSSNSRRLVEVAERFGAKRALLLQNAREINWQDLAPAQIIGLSAGASAPDILINEIIEAFKSRYQLTIELITAAKEDESFLVNRELRDIALAPSDMAFLKGPLA